MLKLVERIVLKPYRCCWGPFRVFFGDPLLRNALQLDLLALAKLGNDGPLAVGVNNHRPADLVVWPRPAYQEVPRVDLHDLVAGATCEERQGDAALIAVALALAVARVLQLLGVFGVQGDEAKAVDRELIGEDGGVGIDLDEIDGYRGNLRQDDAPQGVGEGEVHVPQGEVDMIFARFAHHHLRVVVLNSIDRVVIHGRHVSTETSESFDKAKEVMLSPSPSLLK